MILMYCWFSSRQNRGNILGMVDSFQRATTNSSSSSMCSLGRHRIIPLPRLSLAGPVTPLTQRLLHKCVSRTSESRPWVDRWLPLLSHPSRNKKLRSCADACGRRPGRLVADPARDPASRKHPLPATGRRRSCWSLQPIWVPVDCSSCQHHVEQKTCLAEYSQPSESWKNKMTAILNCYLLE